MVHSFFKNTLGIFVITPREGEGSCRSCVWSWPHTLFWRIWDIDVVVLCVCRCVLYSTHEFLIVGGVFCLFTFFWGFFDEINIVFSLFSFFCFFSPVVTVVLAPRAFLLMFVLF